MKHRILLNISVASLPLLFLVLIGAVRAQGPEQSGKIITQDDLGKAFTYQGRLKHNNTSVNDTCDFTFDLYDEAGSGNPPSGGNKLGTTVNRNNVLVNDGYFTVGLDFNDVFTGTARYLHIAVNCNGTGAATLSPRQELTPAPYAFFAKKIPPGSRYKNLIVVAKGGGDFTSIQAALDSITDNSASSPYLIWVAPGTYAEKVTMKEYIDIEGAGELVTKITAPGSTLATGTLVGANNAELRFLTVENTGGSTGATAIYNSSASPKLTHVTAIASGGQTTYGIFNSSSSPIMVDVTASASDGAVNLGISNNSSSSPMMMNVTAVASSGAGDNRGVENNSSSVTMINVVATALGGGSGDTRGVVNSSASATMTNVTAIASGGAFNYGIYNTAASGSYTVKINNSTFSGSTHSLVNDSEFTTFIGASQMAGGPVLGAGSLTCIGVFDENYTNGGGYTACP